MPLSLIGPAAFAQAAGESKATPASNKEIFVYRAFGITTFCTARAAGVEFPKAIGIAASSYAQVLGGLHGGFVASAGTTKLTAKQLFGGAEAQIVQGAVQACPKEVPDDVKDKLKEAMEKLKKNK